MELLKRMTIEVKGVRPPLLSKEVYRILDELRGFRHVFRHAYSYELDPEKVIQLAEKALKLEEAFRRDIEAFKEKLT